MRLFIDNAGISPLHYLRLIRLKRARQSLNTARRSPAPPPSPASAPTCNCAGLEPPMGRLAAGRGKGRGGSGAARDRITSKAVMASGGVGKGRWLPR